MDRREVLWFCGNPTSRIIETFNARRMNVQKTSSPSDEHIAASCASIFDIKKYSGGVAKKTKEQVPRCIIHGSRVIIRCKTEDLLKLKANLKSFEGSLYYFDESRGNDDLVEEARHWGYEAGPIFNPDLIIKGDDKSFEEEEIILLKRAFHDCSDIELLKLTEGKSQALVFRAHARIGPNAQISESAPFSFVLPFLVKIDTRENVATELENFDQYIAPHVPFSQRPNMASGRSMLGAARGILVGDFVEDAVSLASICENPSARTAIYALFDDALRSWRRHAYAEPDRSADSFSSQMSNLIREEEIPPVIIEIAKKLGLKSTTSELVSRLNKASVFPYRCGIIHGDLHPGNIMVRGVEPILIDFLSIQPKKPLIADVACLEVAICFTVAATDVAKGRDRVHREPFKLWRQQIDKLFDKHCLRYVPPLQEPPSKYSWLWSACRQTRLMAHQVGAEGPPYAAALAAYLLRRTRLGGRQGENLKIAAYALRTAERVIGCLEKDIAS